MGDFRFQMICYNTWDTQYVYHGYFLCVFVLDVFLSLTSILLIASKVSGDGW